MPQNYKNHVRFDPLTHFALAPLALILVTLSIRLCIQHPDGLHLILIILEIAVFLVAMKSRFYSLKVQDRVIRLEERLRLQALLPLSEHDRIQEATIQQLVALRFASDTELPTLFHRAVREGLTSKQIKQNIQTWRADEFRV